MTRIFEALDTTVNSGLILTDIYRKMQEAVRIQTVAVPTLVAQRFGPKDIPGTSLELRLQTPSSLAFKRKAERAKAWEDEEVYTPLTYTPKTWGVDIVASDEIQEDSLFNVLTMNAQTAAEEYGILVDNSFFSAVETGADANTSAHKTTITADITNTDIVDTMAFLETDNAPPTHFVVCVDHATELRQLDTFVEADKVGSREEFANGFLGRIHGMDMLRTNNNYTANSSYIVNKNKAIAMTEKRPLRLRAWNDVRRGESGFTADARFSLDYLYTEACSYITG